MTPEHRMDCEDVERALRAGADLAPLQTHIAVCEACQMLVGDAGALAHRLAEIELSGDDHVESVVEGVMAEVARRPRWALSTSARRRLLYGVLLTLAAVGVARAHDGLGTDQIAWICIMALGFPDLELRYLTRPVHEVGLLHAAGLRNEPNAVVPGLGRHIWFSAASPPVIALLYTWVVADRAEVDPELWAHATQHCATVGTAYGAGFVLLIWLTDRRSTMIARWWLAAIGVAGLATTAYLMLVCPMTEWRHLFASHVLWVVPWLLIAVPRLLARMGLRA
jgi:hypothetical protein